MQFVFPWKNKTQIKEAPNSNSNGTINKKNYRNFLVKAIGFISSQGAFREGFQNAEFDLEEIKRASESDSYIKMALIRYGDLMFKAGYDLKSDNDDAVVYLKTRFRIMGFATSKPMDILFHEIADDLIKYSNAFIAKSRVDKIMSSVQAKGVFNKKPVGGYFRLDPITMKIQRDINGNVIKYQQNAGGDKVKEFLPTDMIHIYLDKDAANAFGSPRLAPALEDVKLLRRIEGNVVSLIYRFAIPIYQWIIGLPEQGFQATDKEITDAQREIENMPLDGVIVTNEKTAIKAIGAEGNALDASAYLSYFEKRVFTALGMSEAMMGRSTQNQNADSMEAQIHDSVKNIQNVMAIFIENFMLNELLLEGGFNPILNEEDIVKFDFDEISLDTKIKLENHEMLKYQSNLNTFDEARHSMGKKGEVDESQLYMNKIENKAALEQIHAKTEGSKELAEINAKNQKQAGAANNQTKNTKPNKDVKTRNNPTNQHGTTSVKIKEELEVKESKKNPIEPHEKSYASIYKRYETLCNDIVTTDTDIDILIQLTRDSMISDIKHYLKVESMFGVEKAFNEIRNANVNTHIVLPQINISLDMFEEEASNTIKELLKDIKKRVNSNNKDQVKIIFNALRYRIRFLLEFIMPKVFWYSYIKAGASLGIKEAEVLFKGSDDADEHDSIINTNNFSIEDIPAFHSFCDCKVKLKVGDK